MCTFVSFSCRRSSISALIGVKVDRMGLMGFLVVNYSAFQLCNVFILARKDITCNRQKEQANNFLFCSLVDDHRYRRWLVWKWVGWVSWEKSPTSNPPGSFVTAAQKKTFWFGTIFLYVSILQSQLKATTSHKSTIFLLIQFCGSNLTLDTKAQKIVTNILGMSKTWCSRVWARNSAKNQLQQWEVIQERTNYPERRR